MNNDKLLRWSLGVVFTVSLSSCTLWDLQQQPQAVHSHQGSVTRGVHHSKTQHEHVTRHNAARENVATHKSEQASKRKPVQKTYATKDPSQKSTPGPVRQAAPQIPVIQ